MEPGLRRERSSSTASVEWPANARVFTRRPVSPESRDAMPLSNSPSRGHGRSPSRPVTAGSQKSFAERATAAHYSPSTDLEDKDAFVNAAERPRPSPLQSDTWSNTPSTTFSTPRFTTIKDSKHRRIDSSSALLTTGNLSHAPPLYPYPPYQAPPYSQQAPPPPPLPAYYNLYQRFWHPAWNMYFFLVMGICFAIGHHLFYLSLEGRDTYNQVRMLRYGATLAFLSKASLATAVIAAFRQRVWVTVRRKMLTLGGVDSLFAAAEDMSAIFNVEVFRHAKVAMLLAIYVWCTPLVVIFSSETLAVELMTKSERTTCPSVRTLNFTHEETNDWRTGQKINNLYELSVSYWNTTSRDTTAPEFFDYFTGTSRQFEEIAILSALLKKPITRTGAGEEICGVGWNCTFMVSFMAPGYKCTELASGVGSVPRMLGEARAPFDTSVLAPTGNFTYYTQAFRGEYADIQTDTGDAGIPNYAPPFPRNLGALRTEPIIWVGYAAVDDPSLPQPDNSSDPRWATAFTPKIFGCEHYETEYTVQFNYTGLTQRTTVLKRTFLRPIIDTTFVPGQLSEDGTLDNVTAVPENNYIYPQDVRRYRRTAAYHSIGSQLRHFVNGTIQEPGKICKTQAIQTRLIDSHSWLGVRNLMDAMQNMYEDMLLSMLSNPQFLAVSWAADPGRVTGTVKGGADTLFPCLRERTDNRFRYHVADLWAVYAVAILLACVAVAMGTMAVWREGVVRDTRFSSIVSATRGPGLEQVSFAGQVPVREDVRQVRVGYGLVQARGLGVMGNVGGGMDFQPPMYSFGMEGSVKQYDGVRPWGSSRGRASSWTQSPRASTSLNRKWFGSPNRQWERLDG